PLTIALRCREAGAQAITLHARTRTQMFSGTADWDEIAALVERLDIPVVGNGDIRTPEDILAMRRHTGCAGIMIARGSFGNPWIFAQGRDLLAGRPRRRDPDPAKRFAVALEHARLALRLQGDSRRTALEFRAPSGASWAARSISRGIPSPPPPGAARCSSSRRARVICPSPRRRPSRRARSATGWRGSRTWAWRASTAFSPRPTRCAARR